MNEILKTVLSLSISGTLLILILFLCKPLFKDRISKCFQYYIWLVVIARMLLPFTPQVSPVGTLFQEIDQAVVRMDPAPGQDMVPETQIEESVKDNPIAQRGAYTTSSAPPVQRLFWLVWLIVGLNLLIRKITIYQGFVKYMKAGRTEVSDTEVLDRLAVIGEQAGVKRPIELYTNSLISSPLLLGFFRPCIILPSADLPAADFQYTILHELTHYRRRDMFYKWLVQLTICLHWFNPFVYRMGREVGHMCELSCDEAVIKGLDTEGQRAYGDTLIHAIGAGGEYKGSLASVTLNESKELLKERLRAIMNFQSKSKLITAAALVMVLLFSAGAVAAGAYAHSEGTPGPAPAAHYDTVASEKNLEIADVNFIINSAVVEVLPADDNKITARYNSEVYTVGISEKEANLWTIDIAGKSGNNKGNNPVEIYLPAIAYGTVSLEIESASLDCGAISSGEIVSTINTSSTHFVLPAGFSGSFKAYVTNGYFELDSKDSYVNSHVTVSGNVNVPDYFKKNGPTSTYSNGSEEVVIEVVASGYAELN